jgi:CheY-like chemotaxis protein
MDLLKEKLLKIQDLNLTILFVEDEEDLLNIMSNAMEKLGIGYLTANSGQEALEHFEKHHRVDVMVVDINMPTMNGIELIEKVRQKYHNLHIAIASAHTEDKYYEKAKELNATYFAKPVDFTDFINYLAELKFAR